VAASPNQGAVGAADIALRPLLRPGEIVENIPGVIVTQHSGSGKANQYFLRGFNLDHGTDLAIGVDGVPVNLPSHAHGQGYADLNFLIPELVQGVEFRKGTYYANVGDFGSAGSFDLRLYDRLPNGLVRLDGGRYGYARAVGGANAEAAGGRGFLAGELEHNDGPWAVGEQAKKVDGVLRWARGGDRSRLRLTLMGYHNDWHATDQVPDRAITTGRIGRFGTVDSTDAGVTGRYAASLDWRGLRTRSTTRLLAYAVRYDLDLFSNFTYFLEDPDHGDQMEQQDRRWIVGGAADHAWSGSFLGRRAEVAAGVQLRSDFIRNGLYHTEARRRLAARTVDRITEASGAPFIEGRINWTPWLRSTLGLREDLYAFDVRDLVGDNSGQVRTALFSPKATIALGPWAETELYLDAGAGFHSNDARGVSAKVDPATPLARGRGAEIGVRSGIVPGLQSSVSLWLLDLTSELVWEGDAGGNSPSGPTRRYGVELANFYTPRPWLTLDADYAWSHARFTDDEPDGRYVPEALVGTFDGGVALHALRGALARASAGLRLRYFGPRPLTQDGRIRSAATSLVYADVAYHPSDRWSVALDLFNLLNTRASDIDYYYASRLPGEPASGVDDIHTHPAEPRSVRVGITRRF